MYKRSIDLNKFFILSQLSFSDKNVGSVLSFITKSERTEDQKKMILMTKNGVDLYDTSSSSTGTVVGSTKKSKKAT
jgi:hypothetical protein